MSKSSLTRPPLFAEDECLTPRVNPDWTQDELLSKKSMFYMKDVARILGVRPKDLKQTAIDLQNQGRNPWQDMGARLVCGKWILRMTTFAGFYRRMQAHQTGRHPISRAG